MALTHEQEDRLREQIERHLCAEAARMMRDAYAASTSATSTSSKPQAPPEPQILMRDLTALMHEWARTNVTVVIVQAHEGPPIRTQHPTEGAFIECSWTQAMDVHRHAPLRLTKVIDQERAHFHVVPPFGFFPATLPEPPYALPEDPEA